MKLISLVDNRCFNTALKSEHGLSVYIETGSCRILFDTGQSDLFLRNASEMGIALSEVDSVIISHAHYDHLGGLISFLEMNSTADVYMNQTAFNFQYYSTKQGSKKFIGYSEELQKYKHRIHLIQEECFQLENLYLITKFQHKYPLPKGNKVLFREKDHVLTNDLFEHEMVVVVSEPEGLCVLSGCAHNGILNIIDTVKATFPEEVIRLVYGGFHLPDNNSFFDTESTLEVQKIAELLMMLAPYAHFYTGHCTGDMALETLKKYAPDRFFQIGVGLMIENY